MTELKTIKTLQFVEGDLSVKREGYGEKEGWAELRFDEKQIEWHAHERGTYAVVEIAPSELRALRDFLNATITEG